MQKPEENSKNRLLNLSKSETGRHLVDILKYSSLRDPLRRRGSTGLFGRPVVDMGVRKKYPKKTEKRELTNGAGWGKIVCNYYKSDDWDSKLVRMRREGAAGVSACEGPFAEPHPRAVRLNRRKAAVGGNGFPPLRGNERMVKDHEFRWYHGVFSSVLFR